MHTGECELIGNDVDGIGVHIAARVQAHANPGQVLVSSTVKDLVVGSRLRFGDGGRAPTEGRSGHVVTVRGDWGRGKLGDWLSVRASAGGR
jgi:class 3 adenylate cyclase